MRRSLAALLLALLLPLPALAGQVTVKPGETLSEIADRYGVSLSRLMQLNGIRKADHVEVGQVLKLPGNARTSGSSSRRIPGATGTVRVQEGDTLSEIADRQGMSLSQLMALNGISKADHVEVGQVLKVSGKPAPAAPTYRRGASTHVVKPGESLSEIADGYGVPMSRLIAINAISDPDHVEVGSRLKLTGPAPTPRPVASSAPARPKPQQPVAAAPATTTARIPLSEAPSGEQAVSKATQAASTTQGAIADPIVSRAATPAANPAVSTSTAIQSRTVEVNSAIAPQASTSPYRSTSASTTPVVAASVNPVRTTSTAAVVATAAANPTPAPRAAASPVVSAAAPSTTTQATAPGDWRRYGPLQVDWSGWQPMGGSLVAPVMNAKGDTLYLAINCGARKLNATSTAGDWRTWDNPQADFELKLVNDLCRSRAS